jgi:uncharacterized protein (DUF697 family)
LRSQISAEIVYGLGMMESSLWPDFLAAALTTEGSAIAPESVSSIEWARESIALAIVKSSEKGQPAPPTKVLSLFFVQKKTPFEKKSEII